MINFSEDKNVIDWSNRSKPHKPRYWLYIIAITVLMAIAHTMDYYDAVGMATEAQEYAPISEERIGDNLYLSIHEGETL